MISKELITKALQMYPQYSLNDECTGNIQYKPNSNVVHFEVNNNGMSQINTYELAHKCKGWALSEGYLIDTRNQGMTTVMHNCKVVFVACSEEDGNNLESDFKACQWILDNKEQK